MINLAKDALSVAAIAVFLWVVFGFMGFGIFTFVKLLIAGQ